MGRDTLVKSYRDLDKYYWIGPSYFSDENAGKFATYLAQNCVWKLDCFGTQFPWDAPIPPRDEWEQKVEEFNQHLIMISSHR